MDISRFFLYPAALFVNKRPHQVTTILGSCVAVCLYDAKLRQGGINHFMLPFWNGQGLASPKLQSKNCMKKCWLWEVKK